MLRTSVTANDSLIHNLEKFIIELMERGRIASLSIALIKNAEIFWCRGFGFTNRELRQPVTTNTIFNVASLSKPVFAYAVLKLVENGLLELDIPLFNYLPEPYIPNEPRLELITTRIVLCHSTGFPNWRPEGKPLRIHFTPGQRFSYSGEGYLYLQRVIEHLTEQPLSEIMRSIALEPLGMHLSSYIWQEKYDEVAAVGHDLNGELVEHPKPAVAIAARTLHTTALEYARFIIAIMEPPKEKGPLLSERFVMAMLSPQIQVNDLAPWNPAWPDSEMTINEQVSWGLGWGIQYQENENSFWQWGHYGPFQAFAMGYKESKCGFVAMANTANGQSLWRRIASETIGGDNPAFDWLEIMYDQWKSAHGIVFQPLGK